MKWLESSKDWCWSRNETSNVVVDAIQILSRDSVTVTVDAVVYFNVVDAEQALCTVDDYRWNAWSDEFQSKNIWPTA